MKTKYISTDSLPYFSLLGFLALLITSCGSQQNRGYYDNDGIYGNGTGRAADTQGTTAQNLYYKDYFGSFTDGQEEAEIFTDVENYRSEGDSTSQQYATGNAGWGNNSDNITVNIYDNNWGYGMWNNYWYGGWNTGWGWNSWYGPRFGWGWNSWYGPGWGMGWNNWYGPGYGWGGYYGNYYINNNYYSNNSGIRGIRNDMYGRSGRTVSDRTYTTGRRVNPNYNSGTRNSTYTGTRNQTATPTRNAVRTRKTTGTRTPNYNTTTTRPATQAPTRNRTYTPARSSSPSSGTIRSTGGGGRSGGTMGGGGGRSSGGGRR